MLIFFCSRHTGNLKASLKAETALGEVCMFPPGHFFKIDAGQHVSLITIISYSVTQAAIRVCA